MIRVTTWTWPLVNSSDSRTSKTPTSTRHSAPRRGPVSPPGRCALLLRLLLVLAFRDNPGVLRDLDLDLYDDGSVRDVAGRWSTGLRFGAWSPAKVGADPETAASFILHAVTQRTDLSDKHSPEPFPKGPRGLLPMALFAKA